MTMPILGIKISNILGFSEGMFKHRIGRERNYAITRIQLDNFHTMLKIWRNRL